MSNGQKEKYFDVYVSVYVNVYLEASVRCSILVLFYAFCSRYSTESIFDAFWKVRATSFCFYTMIIKMCCFLGMVGCLSSFLITFCVAFVANVYRVGLCFLYVSVLRL